MDISSRITESQIEYHPETDSSSTTGSLNNSDIDTAVTCASQTVTQRPVQVASVQNGILS